MTADNDLDRTIAKIDEQMENLLVDVIVRVGAGQVANGTRSIEEVVEITGKNGGAKIIVENLTKRGKP